MEVVADYPTRLVKSYSVILLKSYSNPAISITITISITGPRPVGADKIKTMSVTLFE